MRRRVAAAVIRSLRAGAASALIALAIMLATGCAYTAIEKKPDGAFRYIPRATAASIGFI